jgi:3-hydroxybutyrate dehydrogenase
MQETVLVTGGGSGIGRGLCQWLAKVNHRVICADIDLSQAQATATGSDNIVPVQVDVTCETSVDAMFHSLVHTPSILINNAGVQHVAPFDTFPITAWDQVVAVTLRGSYLLTRRILPTMRENSHGRIINIGSIHSLVASPFKSAYVAAKHGLLGFSKVVALETADVDITINTICPSYVRTPLVDRQIASQAEHHKLSEEEVIQQIMLAPMPKAVFIEIDEIAETIKFLASAAARNITGQEIVIDGGWTIK